MIRFVALTLGVLALASITFAVHCLCHNKPTVADRFITIGFALIVAGFALLPVIGVW